MRFAKIKYLLTALMLIMSITVSSQGRPSNEYQLKAVFLYNFARFTTWPDQTLPDGAPFVIGVVGVDPFGSYLDEIVKGEKIQGHAIVVQRFASAESVKPCHILFINLADKGSVRQLTIRANQEHILTVGDGMTVEKQGGMIRLVSENNRTRFRINVTAASDAGLTISSKLLTLAEIIKE